ncbi:hypothetical protein AB6A40_003670 [Gnathostoma spinigerum]|uniref:Anoctamin n=1 Tax=Gnathostoma spinigerum TaxID=75299 RepID=A0ABD6EHV0_9BILA
MSCSPENKKRLRLQLKEDDESSFENVDPAMPEVCTLKSRPSIFAGYLRTLQTKLEEIIQDGIAQGQRFALCSDIWRFANPTERCDVLITLKPTEDEDHDSSELALILVELMKKVEPELEIEIRYHSYTSCYALYITASYLSLLKGAELCHLKKAVKAKFGGGMKDFCFEDAQCFLNVEKKHIFLSSMERSMIIKQIVDTIRTPPGGIALTLEGGEMIKISEGRSIVSSLRSKGLVGQILPLHRSSELKVLKDSWILRPFEEQPLDRINNYFGTEIAMYFAWLGHMTMSLWFPAVFGILLFFISGRKYGGLDGLSAEGAKDHESHLFADFCFVLFAVFNCVWSTTYLESWKRRQAEYAFKWGTYEVGSDPLLEETRPEFKGETFAPNPVSGAMEPVYPEWKHRAVRYCISYPVTIFCVVVMFSAMLLTFSMQDHVQHRFGESTYLWWVSSLPMIAYALLILIGDNVYRILAFFLNDLENYRTDVEYEDYLITKVVLYQISSAFGSLFYIAFYLRDMAKLRETLATLLITRQMTQNAMEALLPFIFEIFKRSRLTYNMTRSMSEGTLRKHCENVRRRTESMMQTDETPSPDIEIGFLLNASSADTSHGGFFRNPFNFMRRRIVGDRNSQVKLLERLSSRTSNTEAEADRKTSDGCKSSRLPVPEFKPTEAPELTQAELESLMPLYVRPLDDYLEMFIQFGYVLLFSPAFPLAAACALVNNLLEIQVDAFKLCNNVQRPFGRRVKNIGAWQKAMEMMGMAGVMVNCALIGQSGLFRRIWPELSLSGQVLIAVIAEHLILATKYMIDLAIPDVPLWIRIETAKVEHFRREVFKNTTKWDTLKLGIGHESSPRTTPKKEKAKGSSFISFSDVFGLRRRGSFHSTTSSVTTNITSCS